jgi:hypothetical protein
MARLEHPLIQVTWHDAHSVGNDEWQAMDSLKDGVCVVVSVGYWLRQPKAKHIILYQSVTDEGSVDNVLYIPLGMVRKIQRLQIPHKKRKKR